MMKRFLKRTLALTLSCVMVFSLAACNRSGNTDETVSTTASGETTGETTTGETTGTTEGATYTLNDYMEAGPVNWNPHAWEMSNEDALMSYINIGFVDTTISEDGSTFEWVYEMADAITDITADYADRDKYGITEDEGRVFQIDLNQAAAWEDGTPINADSYMYSMEQLLNPEMKNYRSNSYTDGAVTVYNGAAYFNNDRAGETRYALLADLGFTTPAEAIAAGYTDLYVDAANFWGVTDESGNGLLSIDDETLVRDPAVEDETAAEAFVSGKYLYDTYLAEGAPYEDRAAEFMAAADGVYEAVDFSEVGLVKVDDYTILYITENPVEMFYFLSNMTSTWLVYEDLYEAGKSTQEGLVATNYCTSVDTTMSYGPYKLTSYETDKQLILDKNENWYGYTDGKHEGEFQTTAIKIDIVSDHNTLLQLFNSGALDSVSLVSDDMTTYRMSDYLLKTDETYTFRWIFATDLDALISLEQTANDGANKRVLSYDDFRKAISLSMDRNRLTSEASTGYKPAYFLLNNMYYTDIANDPESQYRKTDAAMEAVLRLYGIEYGAGQTYATAEEAYAAVTGYDVDAARELFQSVYEQAIADGNYTDGQEVHINCMATASSALTADDIAQQDLMNEFVTAATVGTGFEGKITFTFAAGAVDRYGDVANGLVEMIRGAWGGAAFYPFSTIRVYCEPEYMGGLSAIHESNGWDPTVETIDVVYDFDGDGTAETVTDTFQNWAKSINGAGAYAADADAALVILSYLETGVLGAYQCIPWGTSTAVSLYSQQIEYATLDYNIMYGYGGIRLMTYNYTDAEWDEYVSSQGGTLSYE